MKRSNWVALVCLLCVLFTASLWVVDVSASAIAHGGGILTLLGHQDPYFIYHTGLILATLSFFSMVLIAVHFLVKD